MILDYQFTLDDYHNAFKAHMKKGASALSRWTMRLGLVVGAVMLLGGIANLINGQRAPSVVLPPFFFAAVWFLIGMGGFYWLSAKRQFTRNPALRQPRRVEIGEDGVKTDAGVASSQMSWKAYLRFIESKDTFLLYTSPACFVIIPKRVLQPSQVDELREILKRNVGKEAAVTVA